MLWHRHLKVIIVCVCTNLNKSIKSHLFEGLAASLQARILAQLKIKEENEERQRRNDLPPQGGSTTGNSRSMPNVSIIQQPHIKTEGTCLEWV